MKCAKDMTPNQLYEHYGDWVKFLAQRYYPRVAHLVDMDELVSSGVLGMLLAQQGYDPNKGAFTTYSRYWVRRQFQLLVEERTHLHKNRKDYGVSIIHNFDHGLTCAPSNLEERVQFNQVLAKTLEGVSQGSRTVFVLYYIHGLPTTEVARKLGKTRQAVHKTITRLKAKLERMVDED